MSGGVLVKAGLTNLIVPLHLLLQEDNGMPVHLKGGSGDALLYRTTMALTVLGKDTYLCNCFKFCATL